MSYGYPGPSDDPNGQQQPGYQYGPQPGQQPGGPPPGYQQPGYQQPGYQQGYPPPGYPQQGYPQGPYGMDPAAPRGYDPYGRPYSDKSKIIAGVLQLLVGVVGAGRWYTGHYGMAVAQLLTCGGLGIWALVDGVYLLVSDQVTDQHGRPLHS